MKIGLEVVKSCASNNAHPICGNLSFVLTPMHFVDYRKNMEYIHMFMDLWIVSADWALEERIESAIRVGTGFRIRVSSYGH